MGIIKFSFTEPPTADEIEGDIALAVLCSECIYGRPRVRMEVSYAVDPRGRACVLETAGEAGEAALRVFAGLVALRVGETGYTVRRLSRGESSSDHPPQAGRQE
jgi:hypothetical protein